MADAGLGDGTRQGATVGDATSPDADSPDAAASEAAEGRIQRLFGSREFFALFNVQLISAIGDWVGFFAITSLAATISSQPEAAIALVMTARIAPGILFTPFVGVIVDRFSRKAVMVVSDLVRAVMFLPCRWCTPCRGWSSRASSSRCSR